MSILDRFRLDGKVALVTGGGRGIGEACALAFAQAGADVVIGARTESQLELVAEKIRAMGQRALCVPLNVMKEDQLANFVDQAMAEFGRIDILVNNAGGGAGPAPALQTSSKQMEADFRFNTVSAFELSKLVAPLMVETAGGGSIVNISSVAGRHPHPCFAAYGVAKASLSFLSQELAQEFAPKVRVNAIAVGSTKTSALDTVLTPEIEQAMVDLTPMNRLGEVEDISACALYLAAPASGYLTGDVLQVNGGLQTLNMIMPRAFS